MPIEMKYLAILFADMSGSSLIYEVLGDQAAQKLVTDCMSILSRVAEDHQGTVIKTIGDEVMCTFPGANLAVTAAIEMHRNLENTVFVNKPGLPPPSIRVGIHWGPVIHERDDVFGDTVNLAARMATIAKSRQILMTEQTVAETPPEMQAMVRCIDRTRVKGKTVEIDIYEFIWEQQDATFMVQRSPLASPSQFRLILRFGYQTIELDSNRPIATPGRRRRTDLVIDDVHVSRTHARIECRRGKFVLIDQSTNGTYVRTQGVESETTLVHRDEVQLSGSGIIGVGRLVDPDSLEAVHFECGS